MSTAYLATTWTIASHFLPLGFSSNCSQRLICLSTHPLGQALPLTSSETVMSSPQFAQSIWEKAYTEYVVNSQSGPGRVREDQDIPNHGAQEPAVGGAGSWSARGGRTKHSKCSELFIPRDPLALPPSRQSQAHTQCPCLWLPCLRLRKWIQTSNGLSVPATNRPPPLHMTSSSLNTYTTF